MSNLFHLLDRAARLVPDKSAVGYGNRPQLSFRQLAARAEALAGHLCNRLGLRPGDRVAIAMKNVPEYIEIVHACWRSGFVAVPMNAKLHEREFAYMLEHSGARAAFVTADLETTIAAAAANAPDLQAIMQTGTPAYEAALKHAPYSGPQPGPEDLAWLFYTSGTTGRPKGAMLTHRNFLAMATSYVVDVDGIGPNDCIVHPAPLSHGAGCYVIPHVMAMTPQVIPESGGFQPDELLEIFRHWSGASLFAAPTMVNRLVRHGPTGASDLSGLKTIIYGGAPMHVADVEYALSVLGPKLAQLYGQGESPMCITGLSKRWYADRDHPRWREIIGSAGFPQSVVRVAVRAPDGMELPVGEAGEICAKGDPVMAGYWRNPEATADAVRDGWLHTGDVGRFDELGFLTLFDRSKDMIISGGSNIYPREVEEILLKHPGVREVSVVGRPHADWGEEVVACVVADEGRAPSEQELDALCQAEIARFKRPKAYVFLGDLPKSAYGKILKRELRAMLEIRNK